MNNKTIVFRIVTSNYCVSTHLKNTLFRLPDNLQFIVIGDNIEIFSIEYPTVKFINIPLKRNFNLIFDLISLFITFIVLNYAIKLQKEACASKFVLIIVVIIITIIVIKPLVCFFK